VSRFPRHERPLWVAEQLLGVVIEGVQLRVSERRKSKDNRTHLEDGGHGTDSVSIEEIGEPADSERLQDEQRLRHDERESMLEHPSGRKVAYGRGTATLNLTATGRLTVGRSVPDDDVVGDEVEA
jgi:hypothetical protein